MTEKHARTRNASQAGGLTDLTSEATRDIGGALASLLADVFALYVKTKNFHWHMSGPHFRDYHLMLDEQSDQIFAMTDPIAEKSSQDRQLDVTVHRPYRTSAAHSRQRRGTC